VIYQEEKVSTNLLKEMTPLLLNHYDEIAHFKDIPFEPDWDGYLKLGEAGILRVFTARLESGELCGYAAFFVKHNLHYKSSLQAVQDVIFMAKEHRGRGGELVMFCDEKLRASGAQAVYHHVKSKHNFGPMLEKFGYELVDLIYARRLT
jgi:GNAT superfamily N-acetyltransferase